jgi:hypothetical protein
MAKPHMTPFQHAAFFPFEIVFLHEAVEHGRGPAVFAAIVLAGLLFARYVGGIFAECYDSLPPESRTARWRVPLVTALVVLPLAANQLGKMLLGLGLAAYQTLFG